MDNCHLIKWVVGIYCLEILDCYSLVDINFGRNKNGKIIKIWKY